MNPKDMAKIFKISNEATQNERDRCLKAVDDEPEFPGDMPPEMWRMMSKIDATEILRRAVRLTKQGIRDRILLDQ
jgi:hypothetical protein